MRTAFVGAAFLLIAQTLLATPCTPDPTTLCLNDQRFRVEVHWEDFEHRTGFGNSVPLTGDTGYFWFFSDTNVELVVKVLDGRALNRHFWVFYGALSNVAYTMTVTDTVTGKRRSYNNPAGTFGSVGDTEAFAASSSDPSREVRIVPGDASTLCPADPTALYLSGCRFRVDVRWKDFSGNTGGGTAVPLTADTGYFWFFNSSNVELIIKVLDGRGLNGEFWVFYGALSNVEYQITVTDTVTGNIKTYSNPSGRFASVGDTSAFRSGYSVTATADEGRSVSNQINPEGGSISATASDGTRFTLTLPAGAILSPEDITLTPVAAIDALPLSGGLRAAVQLKPEGLRLLQPAMLLIDSPVPLSSGNLKPITFGYHRTGDEFHLYPAVISGSKAEFQVMHFSGYGAGTGTDGDVAAQQQRTPAAAEDRAQQDLAAGMQRLAMLQAWWGALVGQLIAAGSNPGAFDSAFSQFLAWQVLALSEPLAIPLIEQGWQLVNVALINALHQAQSDCSRDPSRVQTILRLAAIASRPELQMRGDSLSLARQLVPKCLTFLLKFDSEMILTSPVVTWDAHVKSEVTFRMELDPSNRPIVIPASAPIDYVSFTTSYQDCTAQTQTMGSTLRIENDAGGTWSRIEFPLDFGDDPFLRSSERQPRDIRLAIDHGTPVDRVLSLTCGNPPHTEPVPSGPLYFRAAWGEWHGGFFGENEYLAEDLFQIRNWEFLGGSPYAQKVYSRSHTDDVVVQTEKTTMQLFHTPMP